ncbi:MAG: creatininase family protein, partial [Burkholderiaceae bacterium]
MTNFNAEINLRLSGIVAFATRLLGDSDTRIGQQSDQHDESTQIGPSGGDIGHRSKPTRGARRRWGGPLAVAFSLAAALPHAAGAANAGRAVGEGASHAAADASAVSGSVWLEDLTSTELKDRIRAGTTTLLVPIGGVEQSGPGIALGKHNQRVRVLVQRIAEALGNAVIAPVVAYVPEGNLAPPTSHMRFT